MNPLSGIRIIELAGIGPIPWAGMLLAGMGAEIIRIDRIPQASGEAPPGPKYEPSRHRRRSIHLDLKSPVGVNALLTLVKHADALIEGMRPGVAERLGVGPTDCMAANPQLVFGRMTGWGQNGPLAFTAGHDINYIALTGALHAIGPRNGPPVPPLNLLGDYGGGAMFLVAGLLAALIKAKRTQVGEIVDAAMIDGVANLMALPYRRLATDNWRDSRGENQLDGGAPWYGVYKTKDNYYMAVGAIEPHFYKIFVHKLGLDLSVLPDRAERLDWPILREKFSNAFLTRSRADWERIFEDTDACVTPILSLTEAPRHKHNVARRTFIDVEGVSIPAPAPRFGVDPAARDQDPIFVSLTSMLDRWGCLPSEIERILSAQPRTRSSE